MSGTDGPQAGDRAYAPDAVSDPFLAATDSDAGEVTPGEALVVDVDGYEGPLDLLLTLARAQKVDIARISVLQLAEQYLAFIREARRLRLELAADYLVMAAWLAYLKSRLLLPDDEDEEEPSGEELAELLAFRLQKLKAMRNAGAALLARNRLGRDVFSRGAPEGIRVVRSSEYSATLYDLLSAYAQRRAISERRQVRFKPLPVISIKEARGRLERMLGHAVDWQPLDAMLASFSSSSDMRQTTVASSFTALLELVREGVVEMRQAEHFEPLFLRRRSNREAAQP